MPFDGIPMPSASLADVPVQGEGLAAPEKTASAPDFNAQFRAQPQAGMGVASHLYRPYLPESSKQEKGFLGIEKPRFTLDSLWSFYPMFRLLGYACDPMYGVLKDYFKNIGITRDANKVPSRAHENVSAALPLPLQGADSYDDYHEKISQNKSTSTPEINNTLQETRQTSATPQAKPSLWSRLNPFDFSEVRTYLNIGETAAFLALATRFYHKDKADLHTNLDLAVSAERGVVKEKLADNDLWKSQNPMVQSAMDRFKWQYRLRFASAPAFSIGLPWGILANAFVITAERTAFYRPIGFDLLKRAVTEVQINNLDSGLAKDKLTDDLVKVMQQTRMDHRQPTIPLNQLNGIRPTLEVIAQDIIDKRFGFAGALYIMGGGVIVPEDPQQTRINYEHVRQVGVSGVAKEAHDIQQTLKVTPAKTWEAHITAQRDAAAQAEKAPIAASASRESLLRQKAELLGRGPVHGGAVNEGRRGSAGMVM
jgi:hypothetical protein